jgi:hypothetical protein
VWLTILVHLNVYINEHDEELRSFFVAHEGQKPLRLWSDEFLGKDGLYDWAKFSYLMTKKMEEHIHDPILKDWILPAFSTTTKHDQAIASIVTMSMMQKYFSYHGEETCGIPSVTLDGQKEDWEKIIESCTWSCEHQVSCGMPCAAPCSRLLCD